jgi:uncharacterized protein YbaP (TraB family)
MFWRRFREKKLRMIWRVTKDSRTSFLVGTAHFSLYSFRNCLTELLKHSECAIFEGPLDPASMDKVVAAGKLADGTGGILDYLDEDTLRTIANVIDVGGPSHRSLLGIGVPIPAAHASLAQTLSGMKPWMAFFGIYSAFLREKGWKHSVDLEAFEIATELGKNVVFMETIEEQVEALESVPWEQMADFLKRISSWDKYTRDFMRWYLDGALAKIARNPYGFPTRTPRIIGRRDEVFCERMAPYLERGSAAVFVGIPHVVGIGRILGQAGYVVQQIE